ncbi:MAG: hydroxyethylthiazole kinase [Firmicutes bacterium]|nr:hydroxyethylthiazole kinase [Bacillota bacterium]
MLETMFNNVKERSPLVHNITNYVTVNDCANILLACGASPIMADDAAEVAEITAVCDGLSINIGTLSRRTTDSMLIAGAKSNEMNHPVVLDPVGDGVSKVRTDTALKLVHDIRLSAIRGNISEIKMLASGSGSVNGVDAGKTDFVTNDKLDSVISLAKAFSDSTGAIIAITGEIDIVASSEKAYINKNGCSYMTNVTGTGCMLSALTCAFISANPDNPLEATAAAVIEMGLAGEIAKQRMRDLDGSGSFRTYLIDAVSNMTAAELVKGAKYEVR